MTDEQKTIMVIDDEVHMVQMLKTVLGQQGYEVVGALDGEDAFRKLITVKPHLIILDMNMPKMGGVAFFHEICNAYDGQPKYPVLVLTARANLEKLFHDLNVDGFMSKPFEIEELLKEVGVILAKRYGEPKQTAPKDEQRQRRVLIVENDAGAFDRLALAFLNAGYVVNAARDGMTAFDRISSGRPDIILIKLGLPDLPGDVLASKLRQMPKTSDIPLILYAAQNTPLDDGIVDQICKKIGIRKLVGTNDAAQLLTEADRFFT